jgi:hypothetical protein
MTSQSEKIYQQKYSVQHCEAKQRGIEWQFTYKTWREWWGDDIVKRGNKKGNLVMARNGDVGPYNPDNVKKLTQEQNAYDGQKGRIRSAEHCKNLSIAKRKLDETRKTNQSQET